jgi:SAM-dependent methyltransferase
MDFGCGSKPYKSLFTVDEYIGVDFAGEGHSHENEQIDVFYDGKHLPFPDEKFDSVFSSEVFEHVFNLPEILLEINRVMKPGARLLFTCPFFWNLHETPNDFARYTPYALNHILKEAGFKVLHQEQTGNSVLCLTQLFLLYFYTHFASKIKNRWLKRILLILVSTPVNLWGLLWSALLPHGKDMYFNNVVLAQKIQADPQLTKQ